MKKAKISLLLILILVISNVLFINTVGAEGSGQLTQGATADNYPGLYAGEYDSKIYYVNVLNFIVSIYDTANDTWTRCDSDSEIVDRSLYVETATVVGNKICILGSNLTYKYAFYIYDIDNNKWTLGDGWRLGEHSALAYNDKLYLIGGVEYDRDDPTWPSATMVDIIMYDPITNSKQVVGETANGDYNVSVLYEDKIYIMDTHNEDVAMTIFDPKNNTTSTTYTEYSFFYPISTGVYRNGDGVAYNGNIYCTYQSPFLIFNIASKSWRTSADMPVDKDIRSTVLINGKIYAFCEDNSLQIYDTSTDTWKTESFDCPCNSAIEYNGKIYIIYQDTMYIYTPYIYSTSTPMKINYADIKQVSAQRHSAAAVTNDGSVITWGDGSYYDLGHGDRDNVYAPKVVEGLTDIQKVAKGKNHTLALDSSGNVWGWGNNSSGEVSSALSGKVYNPTKISGISNVVDIAAGTGFSAAIKSDGTVWTWGKTESVLGRTGTSAPGQVDGISSATKIMCGENFAATLSGTTLYTWGANVCGQLGNGTTIESSTPVSVSGSFTDISASKEHILAIATSGRLYSWGKNSVGQLGLNDKTNRTKPTLVNALGGTVVSIGTGYNHSMAILSTGMLYTWGEGRDGQLGNGLYETKRIPVRVGSLTNIISVTGGNDFTIALDGSGNMWSFGTNTYGQLGLIKY